MSVLWFLFGLLFALAFGHFVVEWFINWLRTRSGVKPRRTNEVDHRIVGLFERTLAFALAFANFPGTYAVLIAWMAAKLALNWKRPSSKESSNAERERRVYGISALMAGTLSLSIGVVGGIIARWP
jgi:hypothetical protein